MTIKPYPQYKPTNLAWLSQIPEHWESVRIGHIFSERREVVSDKDFQPLSVTMQGIVPQLDTAAKTNNGDNRKKVCKGDFVINSRSDRKGSSGISLADGSVSVINTVLNPREAVSPQYIEYSLKSYHFKEEFYRYGKGIVDDLWSTKFSSMKQMWIPLPPPAEQTAIAEFLDRKTTQIDTAIAKKKQLIELLKEQKQAMISNTVKSYCNNFQKVKLSYLTNKITDGTHSTPTYTSSGVPFVRVTDIQQGDINLDNVAFISKEEHEELVKRCKPEKGDVLLSKNGTIGKTKVIDWDWDFSIFVSLCLIKPRKNLNPYYLSLFLQTEDAILQMLDGSKTTSVTNLHLEKIREVKILLPSLEIQATIIDHIERESQQIDTTISRIEREIELLKEYRTTLIANAVTGKIKVI